MKIGNIHLRNNLVLAPMACVTDLPFRLLAVEKGCGLVVSEMVSAKGLAMGGKKTLQLIATSPAERPVAVQLFGSDPDNMAEAAAILEGEGVEMIDINMGCPVKKVVKDGSGSALLKEPKRVEQILKEVRKRITIPLTIKIRTGWDSSVIVAPVILKIAEACGVDGLAIHGRTRAQGFGGKADWSIIREIKEIAAIPIIGNGDISLPEDAARMMEQTGCDGVMIGRAAMGNPWIFSQAASLMEKGFYGEPDLAEKRETVLKHLQLVLEMYGEVKGARLFRKHLSWYTKGLHGSSVFRSRINRSGSSAGMTALINEFFSPGASSFDGAGMGVGESASSAVDMI